MHPKTVARSAAVLVAGGLASSAHAALPTGVSEAFSTMSADFTSLFALAFPVLVVITVSMLAWRYTRKLGNKV